MSANLVFAAVEMVSPFFSASRRAKIAAASLRVMLRLGPKVPSV